MSPRLNVLTLCALFAACTQDTTGEIGNFSDESGSTAADDSTDDSGMDADSDATTGEDAGEDESETDSGPLLDIGSGTAEGGDDLGCEKIDFLFVIDNSGSMAQHQDNLIASFPAFLEQILAEVPTLEGHHIMVVDSDAVPGQDGMGNGYCDYLDEDCGGISGQVEGCETYPCGKIAELEGCEVTLGSGIDQTWDRDSPNMECGFPAERRWLSTEDANLEDAFGCAATLRGGYGQEAMMGSLVSAVGPQAGEGQCNEGFLRDDALLVVTIITNAANTGDNNLENVDSSVGGDLNQDGAQAWHDAVLAAKDGQEAAVVVIGLLPQDTCSSHTDNYEEFVNLFGDKGLVGNLCDEDYGQTFADGVSVIDTACDEFIPPG